MLQVPIHSVLDGVTVYADDSLFFVYYLIPDAPSVRLDENGHPVFLLVTYQFSADDRRDHPDLPNGGGYLNFDTELAVPEVTLAKIRATLQADVDVEWNRRRAGTPAEQASQGVAGTTEAPKVRFDSPTWTAGKVALDAPQATSLVTARVSEGSPSLLQGDTAVFNLDLTPAGATFMEDSLTKPDGSGATDLTPIQVAYDLSFWARLPAATIVVSANSSKIHEYIHNKGMGRSTDYWTPYELGILLWRRWAPRPTDNTTDTVTTTGEITVAIDQGSGSMPAEVLDALRDYAIDLVKQMITSTFFTSSPAVAPKDPKPVQGEAPRYYLREYDSVTMSLDVTLEQRSVVEWRVYPQATLESSFRGMSTTDLAHYVRKISLDDPFWRTLEVDVRAFADWAGPVNWVTVDLEYDPPGSVPKPMSFTFDSAHADPQHWSENIEEGDVSYRYRTTIAFDDLGPQPASEWTTTTVPAINVQATAPTLDVTVLAGDIDFSTVDKVEVTIAYEDPAQGVPREEHTVVLTAAMIQDSYRRIIYKPITQQAQYRTRFTLISGDVQEDHVWRPVGGPQIVINADRSAVLRVGLLPAGDGWDDVVRVLVDLSYADPANSYTVSTSMDLEAITQFKTWTVPLKNKSLRSYRYRWTASYKNGDLVKTDWQQAPAGTETLPIAIHRPGINVTLVADAIDFSVTPIVEVTCHYAHGDVDRQQTFVLKQPGVQMWHVDVPEGAPTDFSCLVTYSVAGGEPVTLAPMVETSNVVIVPAYQRGANVISVAIFATLIDFVTTPMVGIDTTYDDDANDVHLTGSFILSPDSPVARWDIQAKDPAEKDFGYTITYYTADGEPHAKPVKHDTVPRIIVPKYAP